MKRRTLSVVMSLAMVATLFTGCGNSQTSSTAEQSATSQTEQSSAASTEESSAVSSAASPTESSATAETGMEGTDNTATYSDLELTDAEKEKAKGLTIGVSYCLMSAPAVKVFAQGVEAEAKELGIEVIELDGEWDAAKQADQVNTFISQKVDGIVLNPCDGTSLVSAAKAGSDAGIPVVTGAMNIDESGYDYIKTFVGPDDADVGRAAAKSMMEALGEAGGKVAIIEGTAGSSAQVNRTAGFEEVVAGSNIEVVAKNSADYDEATAMSIAEDLLTKYPDLKGVFCHDDTMASGCVQAMKELGYNGDDVKVVGYGGSAKGASLVEEGYMVATAVQPLVNEGRGCIKALVKAINGEDLSIWYKDEITPLDASNVADYDKSLLW